MPSLLRGKEKSQERPYYIYRENKGYFYGPGAGSVLEGKPVDWISSNSAVSATANERTGQ